MPLSSIKALPWRRIGIATLVFLVVFGLFGYFVLPAIVKSVLEKKASEFLGRQLSVERVDINPYSLELTLDGFKLREQDGKDVAAAFDSLHVNVQWQSLFRLAPVVREIRLERPKVRIVRLEDGRYNWSDLIDLMLKQPKSEGESHFALHNIRIQGGALDFDDRPRNSRHVISDLELGVPFVSNLNADVETFVEPSFSARIDGAALSLTGKVRPFQTQPEATLELKFDDLDLTRFDEYSPVPLGFSLASAKLGAAVELAFRTHEDGRPELRLSGTVALRDFDTRLHDDSPLLKVAALDIELKRIEPLAGVFEIGRVRIEHPEMAVTRAADGTLNLLRAMPPPTQPAAPSTPAGNAPAPRFSVAELELVHGAVRVDDRVPAGGFRIALQPLELTLRNLSNQPGARAELSFKASADAGEQLALDASLGLQPMSVEGQLQLSGVKLARLKAYYQDAVDADLIDGTLVLTAAGSYAIQDDQPVINARLEQAELSHLAVRRSGEKAPVLQLARIKLEGGAVDVQAHSVDIASLRIDQPRVAVVRDDQGIDLTRLAKSRAPAAPLPAKPAGAAEVSAPWSVQLQNFELAEGELRFEDRTLAQVARFDLAGLRVKAANVGLGKPLKSTLEIGFKDRRKGSFAAQGAFALEPLQANLRIDARQLDLLPAQPYLADAMNAELLKGFVSARGRLDLAQPKSGGISVKWNGDLGVDAFHLTEKINASDLLKWKSLAITGVDAAIDTGAAAPLTRLSVDGVALSDYYARVIVSAQGKLNLSQIMRDKPEAPKMSEGVPAPDNAGSSSKTAVTSAAAGAPPPIVLRTITLQGGTINFSDFFIKPNFQAHLTHMGGRISNLSSAAGSTGEILLRGNVDGTAPVEVSGRLNPLAQKPMLDIKASARGIELAPFSPYSGKHIGYGIEKGKLTVNVAYKIDNDQLTAQNNVILDQLTFGEAVDSPDALNLPVRLAVSLLKDRNGVIDLNLPISGSLSDPQFSVGGIIVKVIVNLIVKAVTAPFALLGNLFSGGPDLDHVAFPSGLAVLGADAEGKLGKLSKALADRPALKLEVTGRVDRAADTDGLRRAQLERKMRAAKAADAKTSLEDTRIEADDYPKWLEKVYRAADFPKPRNLVGMAKSLPVEEMEKLIFTHTEVSDEDLRVLGLARAQAVKDYLTRSGGVADERIFVVAPKVVGADQPEAGKDAGTVATRADFSLK